MTTPEVRKSVMGGNGGRCPGRPDLGEFTEVMMDNNELRRLRFDVRLKGRRGWTSAAEFEEKLSQLPDVSDKMESPEEDGPTSDEPPAQAGSPETGEV
jgi:hypothetical protein